MLNKSVIFSTTCVLIFGLSGALVQASTININATDGEHYETKHGIRADTATRGGDLAGMRVTATFADGSSESDIWERFNFTNGGFDGVNFDMSFGWRNFELTNEKTMTSLLLEADLGNSIFDIGGYGTAIAPFPSVDTPTTKVGYPFEIFGTDTLVGTIEATYSNIVSFVGVDPVGDVYTDLLLDFTGLAGGGLDGGLAFKTDLDTLLHAGDLQVSSVPVPPTLPLLLSCLGLLGVTRLRRSWVPVRA